MILTIILNIILNFRSLSDAQARGIKSLIRNISSGTSPVLGRKDSANERNKRSGSVGSNRSSWIPGSSNN